MTIPVVYDPRYHTWDSWACLMCEAYAAQQLSIPGGEQDWKAWARGLKGISSFDRDGVPGPDPFTNWQEWAVALVNAVNNPSQ